MSVRKVSAIVTIFAVLLMGAGIFWAAVQYAHRHPGDSILPAIMGGMLAGVALMVAFFIWYYLVLRDPLRQQAS